MTNEIERMREWVHELRDDAGLLKELIAAPEGAPEARALAAGALGYLVTRMDIVPDWDPTCGTLDDAMVLRVAMAIAAEKDLGTLRGETLQGLVRLGNESELVAGLLGGELYQKFTRFVRELGRKEVRRRTPATIIEDEGAQRSLFAEVDEELAKVPTPKSAPHDQVARTLRNYFALKLKSY